MKNSKSASNSRDLKVLNRLSVLNTIRKNGPIARYEVAKITSLTPPTVTVIVNDLIKAGIVNEIGAGESSGGRKPVLLKLNPQSGFVFTVRLQHGEMMTALLDIAGNIWESRCLKIDTTVPEEVVAAAKNSLDLFIEQAGILKEKILWCGVASAGLINFKQGMVEHSYNLGWRKVPFGTMLSESLEVPVHIENISNAAALGEKVYGSGRGSADLIYLNLSVGIGAGVVIGNEVYNGVLGYAGEVGHMILLPENGPQCSCGNFGCFEAICGVRPVLERIKAEVPEELFETLGISKQRFSINDLMIPSFRENSEVRAVLARVEYLIGIAIANLVNLFDIPVIILGGELAKVIRMDVVTRKIKENTLKEIGESVQVIHSTMQDDPPLMGVYALVMEKLFATDEWLQRKLGEAD